MEVIRNGLWITNYARWRTLFWLIPLALLLLVIYSAFRAFSPQKESQVTDALEILKARYAKGEINNEEYERMKRELT
ncbi:SHOCT domain-containing protein [Tepidibacillus marianensis]|uniref:SHOCT domain-containing protein n=1 Tax=Tepidibacillus marianensis TaxID=3131995 RepID=UPI0030CDB068